MGFFLEKKLEIHIGQDLKKEEFCPKKVGNVEIRGELRKKSWKLVGNGVGNVEIRGEL